MARSQRGRDLFYNRRALKEIFVPAEVPSRGEQLNSLRKAFESVHEGDTPKKIIVHGDSGTGKTLVTKKLVDDFQREVVRRGGIDFDPYWINCRSLCTAYQVAVTVCNKLRSDDDQLPRNGIDRDTIFDLLHEEIDAFSGSGLIVLDEIRMVKDSEELFSLFSQVKSSIGWVLISSDIALLEDASSLVYDFEVEFPPYSKADLMTILEHRTEKAFRQDALDYGVVEYIAATSVDCQNNVTRAIEILQMAGEVAMASRSRKIRTAHVTEAEQRIEHDELASKVADLNNQSRLILAAVLSVEEPRRQIIQDKYATLCMAAGIPVLSRRSVHNHLKKLCDDRILSSMENRTGSRGNYLTYKVCFDEDLLRELLVPDTLEI